MKLDEAIAAIDALLPRLDVPLEGLPRHGMLILGLGMRAASLYRTAIRLTDTSTDASMILVRSLADLAITIRWIEDCPKVHFRLWVTEDDRLRLVMDDRRGEFAERRAEPFEPAFDLAERQRMERRVSRARKLGRLAGIPIGRDRGPLLPTLEGRSEAGDMWETYHIIVRYASNWTHTGGRAMVHDRVEVAEGKSYLRMGEDTDPTMVKALAVPLVCAALASVSRQCGAGVHEDFGAIQRRVVPS